MNAMCTPKAPKVEKVPVRQAALMPDNGDPAGAARARRRGVGNLTDTTAALFRAGMVAPSTAKLGVAA